MAELFWAWFLGCGRGETWWLSSMSRVLDDWAPPGPFRGWFLNRASVGACWLMPLSRVLDEWVWPGSFPGLVLEVWPRRILLVDASAQGCRSSSGELSLGAATMPRTPLNVRTRDAHFPSGCCWLLKSSMLGACFGPF